MKKSILLYLLIIAFIFPLNSCKDNSTGPVIPLTGEELSPISIRWDSTNSIVCFGTSLTYGYNPEGPVGKQVEFIDSSYPGFLNRKLKINVLNKGVVGATISRGIELLDDSVFTENPAFIILEFGANDFFRGITPDSAGVLLNKLIKRIKEKNIPMVLLSFINPDMIEKTPEDHILRQYSDIAIAYYDMLKNTASQNSILFMDYLFKNIWGSESLMSEDGIHPNNKGYEVMYQNVYRALFLTFAENGMIREDKIAAHR